MGGASSLAGAPAHLARRGSSDQDAEPVTVDDAAHGLVLQTLLLEAIEAAQMAIVVYDETGRYVTVNDCACELLGYTRQELLTHDVGDFTDGIDRSLLMREQRREGVRVVRRKDGTTTPVAFVVVPSTVGNLPYFVAAWWALESDDPRAATAT